MGPLVAQGHETALWKPAHWADVLAPVADFLRICLQRFRSDEPEKLAEVVATLEALSAAAHAFEPGSPKSAGHNKVMSCVRDLQGCATHAPLHVCQ